VLLQLPGDDLPKAFSLPRAVRKPSQPILASSRASAASFLSAARSSIFAIANPETKPFHGHPNNLGVLRLSRDVGLWYV